MYISIPILFKELNVIAVLKSKMAATVIAYHDDFSSKPSSDRCDSTFYAMEGWGEIRFTHYSTIEFNCDIEIQDGCHRR